MTKEQADALFGRVVWQNEQVRVRVRERADKKGIEVVVFQVINGVEHKPLGIVLGSNGLDYEYK